MVPQGRNLGNGQDEAREIVEIVANALGTSLRHYMESTQRRALEAATEWLWERRA